MGIVTREPPVAVTVTEPSIVAPTEPGVTEAASPTRPPGQSAGTTVGGVRLRPGRLASAVTTRETDRAGGVVVQVPPTQTSTGTRGTTTGPRASRTGMAADAVPASASYTMIMSAPTSSDLRNMSKPPSNGVGRGMRTDR